MNLLSLFIILALPLSENWGNNDMSDSLGITSSSANNVTELLRGRISGVRVSNVDCNPVGNIDVNIRGVNSLRTNNQPLWIVDGTVVSTSLNDNLDAFWQYGEQSYTSPLNPLAFLDANMVESIEVLKDASATAVYGSRGANGVIIVNTKMPKSGERNIWWTSNAGISFNGRTALNHNHYLSFNGTSGNTSYNISGNFRSINGPVARNGSNYGSVDGRLDMHANKYIWFGLNSIISVGSSSSPTGVAFLGMPSMTLAMRDSGMSSTTVDEWSAGYDDDMEDYRAVASSYLRFNITRNLYLKLSGGVDFQSARRIIWYGPETEFGRPCPQNQYGGMASNLISKLLGYNVKAILSYDKYFKEKHHLELDASWEQIGNTDKANEMNGNNFLYNNLRGKSLNVGNYDYYAHKFFRNTLTSGIYGRIAYEFDELVGLCGIFRYDCTPKYGKYARNTYPSLSAYINFHDLFFKSFKTVSSLRIESGYGESGLEKYVPYDLFGNYLSGSWFVPEESTSPFYDGLSALRTKEWHISLVSSYLSDRINLGVTFFDRTTTDSFSMIQMGGFSSEYYSWKFAPHAEFKEITEVFNRTSGVRNRGIEFDLFADVLRGHDFKWSIDANISTLENQVTTSNSDDFFGSAVGQGIICTCNAVSRPVSCLYGYLSDENGNLLDTTGEGRITTNDKVILGNTVPVVYGGLENSIKYRNLSLEILLEGAAGHNIANINALTKDGVKGPDGLIALTSKYVEKGDYLRVRSIGFAYDIPVSAKWLHSLNARVAVTNPFTITGYKGWNPDVNCFSASTLSNGLDYGSFPLMKMFMVGINAKF